ncbi:tRNA pseudouridine(54/55) synthase Pus10 [Methanosphaera sp.]
MTNIEENNNTDENNYVLCPECLSRIYRKPEDKKNSKIPLITDSQKCSICNNLMLNKDKLYNLILKKINLLNIEFDTFLIACQINNQTLIKNQQKINKITNYNGNNDLKHAIRRDMTQMLVEKLGKTVDYKNPEVVIMIKVRKKAYKHNPYYEIKNVNIFLDSNPIFIEGRYRKLVRGIPQTKWPCTECKGKGCEACNYTGRQYEDTVEDLISKQILKMTRGNSTKFHGSGREDIDVLMLGEGRPFVIEVKHPFKRKIDLKLLRRLVNSHSEGKIEINDLKYVDRARKATIKNSSVESYKIYSAIADFENGVTSKDIAAIEKLKVIEQRTPVRVEHRRADLIRTREINNIEVERINSKQLRLIINCQGGLYIKELISGDDNRTQPSISQITNNKAICSQLDVLKVHIPL